MLHQRSRTKLLSLGQS